MTTSPDTTIPTAEGKAAITQADVERSYELCALLEVCLGAAQQVSEQLPPGDPLQHVAGNLPNVLQQAVRKWDQVHAALELAHDATEA